MSPVEIISRTLAYPLWDLKDGSRRLKEYGTLANSQWYSEDRLAGIQQHRLASIVRYAYEHTDFYPRHWGCAPIIENLSDLASLPLVRKTDIRGGGDSLLTREFPKEQLIAATTGGSTGVSLSVYFDSQCQEYRNAAAMRSDSWSGWRPGMLVAALWGTPPIPRTLKERVRNALHDRLFFLDTMNLNEITMHGFLEEMWRRKPGGLFGHAHSLFVFSRFIDESGLSAPPMKSVVATSMMLLEPERIVIEKVFNCAVTNRYGCEEVGLIACECERHGGLHVNSEHVIVELLRPDGTPAAQGEEGEVVVTDLINRGMPLIRYAIEDVAVWSTEPCPCGRGLPSLERVVGRLADFLFRRDGSLVAGVSLVEKTLTVIEGIEQLQIIQEEMDRFSLNVVPTSSFSDDSRTELENAIHDVFGCDIRLEIHVMDRLPQERNSKYRFAICKVDRAGHI